MDLDFLLIQRIKNGNDEAIEYFVKKYYPEIFQYCLLHIYDRGHAEDLTQETFMKFFQSLDRYKHYGKAINYLYVIAANSCKDYYKKQKELLYGESPETSADETATADSSDNMTLSGIRMDVEKAVARLPEELRETVILFYFQELKQKEIAKQEHISLSLVKYRIARAKNYWQNIWERSHSNG